jgi:hypothetical protein
MISAAAQAVFSHEGVSRMRLPAGNVGHDEQFSIPAGYVINQDGRDFTADAPIGGKRYGAAGNPRQARGGRR